MGLVKWKPPVCSGYRVRLWSVLSVVWGTFAMNSVEAMASTTAKVDCDAEFVRIMEDAQQYPDARSKTNRLESLGSQCEGTGIYESRLGGLYSEQGRYDDARKVLLSGLGRETQYNKQIRIALFDVEFRQQHLPKAEAEALALIKDFPDWVGGYGALGQVRLVQHRFQEGIEDLERANSLEPTSGAYTLLAMAYYQVDRPRDSAIAMQKALRIDKDALAHTQAVCATAYSLVALGHLPEAEDLLAKHLKVQPKAVNDPTYQAASALIEKRIQEQRGKSSAVR